MYSTENTPPFLLTYWNPFSQDSNLVQSWFDYVRDISLADYTAEAVGLYMEQVSGEQIRAIHATGNKICGVFYEGLSALRDEVGSVQCQLQVVQGQLSNVQGRLHQMAEQLGHMHAQLQEVNQRLGLLLDEARTGNLLQQNIAELLRIPDSQKQRQHHIELGLKFLKNARMDEDLYQDALNELLEAEKMMQADYFVLHRIGLIYLYAPAVGNLEKALDYFVRAAKYAVVESDPEAARLKNILSKNVSTRFAQQPEPSSGDISALAAESYHEAGTVFYAMGRHEEAASMAEKAVKRGAGVGKYHFFFAKYLARAGRTDSAVRQLQRAVELAPEMAIAAIGDFDLNQLQPVLDSLEALNSSVDSQLADGIQRLEKWAESNIRSGETDVPEWTARAKDALQAGTYFQKREIAEKLALYDDATLSILPEYSKTMASLNEAFIGQERIKGRFARTVHSVECAIREWDARDAGSELSSYEKMVQFDPQPILGHILLLGPAGMGKSTLAHALAQTTKQVYKERISDPDFLECMLKYCDFTKIVDQGCLAGMLTTLERGYIVFAEDFDKLLPEIQEDSRKSS